MENKEIIKTLRDLADTIETANLEIEKTKLEYELKAVKLERGIETLQERIKLKDDMIGDLKDIFQVLKPKTSQVKQ